MRARATAAGSTEWCHVSYDSARSRRRRKSSGLSSSRSERSDPTRSGAPEGGAVRPHQPWNSRASARCLELGLVTVTVV
eukprot:4259436-Prymnesium_polylepis.1